MLWGLRGITKEPGLIYVSRCAISSRKNEEYQKTEAVADYVRQYTDSLGFNVIYDSVGEKNLLKSIGAGTLNRHIATTSAMTEFDLTMAHLKGLSLHMVFVLIPMIHYLNREKHGKILAKITKMVEAGNLKPVLADKQLALNKTSDTYTYLESGSSIEKEVLNY